MWFSSFFEKALVNRVNLRIDQIEEAAQAAGVSREEASSGLARILPQLIDKLTPDGKLPEGDAIGQALAALKSKSMG